MKPLYFVHIPKTGGRAVAEFMLRQSPRFAWPHMEKGGVYPGSHFPRSVEELLQWRRAHAANAQAIAGHFPAGVMRLADCYEITVLRDPVERLFSLHRFLGDRQAEWYDPRLFRWLRLAKIGGRPQVCEVYTRILSGTDFRDPRKMTQEDKNRATSTLEEMALVGVTEHLDVFGRRLSKLCGWHDLAMPIVGSADGRSAAHKNLSEKQSATTINMARDCAGFDLELYALAKSIQDKKCNF